MIPPTGRRCARTRRKPRASGDDPRARAYVHAGTRVNPARAGMIQRSHMVEADQPG